MIAQMRGILEGKIPEGKKPVKPQDLVRLYETIIQNFNDQPALAGLEEDLDFKHEIEAKVIYYKAWRYEKEKKNYKSFCFFNLSVLFLGVTTSPRSSWAPRSGRRPWRSSRGRPSTPRRPRPRRPGWTRT